MSMNYFEREQSSIAKETVRITLLKRSIIVSLLFCLMIFMTACGDDKAGTYYEWSYSNEGNAKIVLAEDGKCLFYAILEEDLSEETYSGEYSQSDNGIIVTLDMGESFELIDEGEYYSFDGNNDSRWYKDKDKATKEWEKVFKKCNEYIENNVYYLAEYDYILDKYCLYFLDINNLDEQGNAEYVIYESNAYDVNSNSNTDFKGLWKKEKQQLEKGTLSFGYSGDIGYINSDSDFIPNCKYHITETGAECLWFDYEYSYSSDDWWSIERE